MVGQAVRVGPRLRDPAVLMALQWLPSVLFFASLRAVSVCSLGGQGPQRGLMPVVIQAARPRPGPGSQDVGEAQDSMKHTPAQTGHVRSTSLHRQRSAGHTATPVLGLASRRPACTWHWKPEWASGPTWASNHLGGYSRA